MARIGVWQLLASMSRGNAEITDARLFRNSLYRRLDSSSGLLDPKCLARCAPIKWEPSLVLWRIARGCSRGWRLTELLWPIRGKKWETSTIGSRRWGIWWSGIGLSFAQGGAIRMSAPSALKTSKLEIRGALRAVIDFTKSVSFYGPTCPERERPRHVHCAEATSKVPHTKLRRWLEWSVRSKKIPRMCKWWKVHHNTYPR